MLESDILEIIGLAFVCGYTAKKALEEDNDNEEIENNEDENIKTGVIKLEGDKAKEFINFIEKKIIKKEEK